MFELWGHNAQLRGKRLEATRLRATINFPNKIKVNQPLSQFVPSNVLLAVFLHNDEPHESKIGDLCGFNLPANLIRVLS